MLVSPRRLARCRNPGNYIVESVSFFIVTCWQTGVISLGFVRKGIARRRSGLKVTCPAYNINVFLFCTTIYHIYHQNSSRFLILLLGGSSR